MGGRELPFQCCPRLQGGALTRVREAVAGISMHSSTWMQHKHPERFQWILFCLIKNTNQACMYYLIYINIYSIYKTNASGQRLSLWHKLQGIERSVLTVLFLALQRDPPATLPLLTHPHWLFSLLWLFEAAVLGILNKTMELCGAQEGFPGNSDRMNPSRCINGLLTD